MSGLSHFEDNADTAQRAVAVIKQLATVFSRIASADSVAARRESQEIFPVAFGWWARITRTSEAVALLYASDLGHESAPLVRSVMQHALALQWLTENGAASLAAVYEYGETHYKNLMDSAEKVDWDLPPGLRTPEPATQKNTWVSELRNFEQMCSLYDDKGIYAVFRILSSYSHPTYHSARAYYLHIEGEEARLSGRSTVSSERYVIQCALSQIQAGLAISMVLQDDRLPEAVRSAAQRLGVSPELLRRRLPRQTDGAIPQNKDPE